MKIGQLARESGLSTKAIRYYEDIGILPSPERAANGYRIYDDAAVDRIAFIRDAQSAGMSLVEIQLVLDLRDSGAQTCGHVIETLEMQLHSIKDQLNDLTRTEKRLKELIHRAKELDPTKCTDPNRCQTIPKGHTHDH